MGVKLSIMIRNSFFLLLLGFVWRCNLPLYAQFTLPEIALGAPVTYKNLQLYPVIANITSSLGMAGKTGNYATLEATMQNRLVQIAEQEPLPQTAVQLAMQNNYPIVPNQNRLIEKYEPVFEANTLDNADTNAIYSPFDNAILDPEIVRLSQLEAQTDRLFITNLSADTIYLIAGEVIKGGRQDRVIAQNMLLPPNTRYAALPVFCVEKNRWDYHHNQNPCFTGYSCIADATLRKTVQLNAQQEDVWNVVNRTTALQNSQTATQAYTALENNSAFIRLADAYVQFLQPILTGNKQIVGVLAVTGNHIAGADIFASNALFTSHVANLLRSYAANAIINGSAPALAHNKVKEYWQQFFTPSGINRTALFNKGKLFENNGQIIHLTLFD